MKHFFRNACINFAGNFYSCMPVNQLFEPRNIRPLAHDHDYLGKCPGNIFLEQFGLTTLTDDEILKIELQTRGQQMNRQWQTERKKKPTTVLPTLEKFVN